MGWHTFPLNKPYIILILPTKPDEKDVMSQRKQKEYKNSIYLCILVYFSLLNTGIPQEILQHEVKLEKLTNVIKLLDL